MSTIYILGQTTMGKLKELMSKLSSFSWFSKIAYKLDIIIIKHICYIDPKYCDGLRLHDSSQILSFLCLNFLSYLILMMIHAFMICNKTNMQTDWTLE